MIGYGRGPRTLALLFVLLSEIAWGRRLTKPIKNFPVDEMPGGNLTRKTGLLG